MDELINNKVKSIGIKTFDIMAYKPKEEVMGLDLSIFLYKGLMLKEKEFKDLIQEFDWSIYEGKALAIYCSTEAIIPSWSYMSLAIKAGEYADQMEYCTVEALTMLLWKRNIRKADLQEYEQEKTVIKAYPDLDPSLYVAVTNLLKDRVKSLFYGEAGLPKVIKK